MNKGLRMLHNLMLAITSWGKNYFWPLGSSVAAKLLLILKFSKRAQSSKMADTMIERLASNSNGSTLSNFYICKANTDKNFGL